jgi:hypothetical protein
VVGVRLSKPSSQGRREGAKERRRKKRRGIMSRDRKVKGK